MGLSDATTPWGRFGASYDDVFTEANMAVADVALRLGELGPGMALLDVAAGGGALSIPAAQMGADVVAVDLSATMLELLDERATASGLAIRTSVMDGTRLGFEDESFDRVCSQFGVMFFADQGLPEMHRVARPGGVVIVVSMGAPERVPLTLYETALARALPEGDGPAGFSPLGDPMSLGPQMEASGLHDVELHVHQQVLAATSAEDLWGWMSGTSPGFATYLSGLRDEQRQAVREALLEVTVERYGKQFDGLSMEIIIGVGTK